VLDGLCWCTLVLSALKAGSLVGDPARGSTPQLYFLLLRRCGARLLGSWPSVSVVAGEVGLVDWK